MKPFLFLLFVTPCFAQTVPQGQTIPQGAETIQLHTQLADSALFRHVTQALLLADYSLAQADPQRGYLATQHKATSGHFATRVLVLIKDRVAFFKSQWADPAINSADQSVRYQSEASADKTAFEGLDHLVEQLRSGLVSTSKYYVLSFSK